MLTGLALEERHTHPLFSGKKAEKHTHLGILFQSEVFLNHLMYFTASLNNITPCQEIVKQPTKPLMKPKDSNKNRLTVSTEGKTRNLINKYQGLMRKNQEKNLGGRSY